MDNLKENIQETATYLLMLTNMYMRAYTRAGACAHAHTHLLPHTILCSVVGESVMKRLSLAQGPQAHTPTGTSEATGAGRRGEPGSV